MTEELKDRIITLFWEGLTDMSWEDWCSISAGDKESIVVDCIPEFVEGVTTEEVTEFFWEWATCLEKSDFED